MKILNNKFPIQKIDIGHRLYPLILKEMKNPPKVLFYRGKPQQSLFKRSLAIVGSRQASQYGKLVTEKFVSFLVNENVTIVSGFMYGIDTAAHQKCLEYGGKTVAVLGNGLDVFYPPENEKLYAQILEAGGVILSEYEPKTKPQLWTFPQRNRIVAGLASLGVLIIEAGEKSGSLITARIARQMGKKVFCVPGPITSSVSAGTNNLLKKHLAKMVTEPSDIFGQKIDKPTLFSTVSLTPIEKKIINLLEIEPLTADEIGRATNKPASEINQVLSILSLKSLIAETSGKYYLES